MGFQVIPKLINQLGDKNNITNSFELANEIDSKYLNDPLLPRENIYLITIESLRRMRSNSEEKAKFSESDLLSLEKYFNRNRKLFLYLSSARFYYVDSDYGKAEHILMSPEFNKKDQIFLDFSRDILLGQIFLSTQRYKDAENHFRALLSKTSMTWMKEAVELGSALAWEHLGTVNKAFEQDTRISSPRIRAILIKNVAGPIILRQEINNSLSLPQEKILSKYVLLFKEITRGQYENFIKDIDIFKSKISTYTLEREIKLSDFDWPGSNEEYKCPSIKNIAIELNTNPTNSHANLCLSDFIRINALDDFEKLKPGKEELGGGKSIFPGSEFSRGEIYKKLIINPNTPEKDRAYALYRAIMCYAPTNINGCGGDDVPVILRKNWFNLIKTKYGNTPWAKRLQYYW